MTRWEELGMTAEEYVRSRWDKAYKYISLIGKWFVRFGPQALETWEFAATYTAEHEEAIRQKREEIATMSEYAEASLSMAESGIENGDSFIAGVGAKGLYTECRILAVLEGQLEGMLKGWKG